MLKETEKGAFARGKYCPAGLRPGGILSEKLGVFRHRQSLTSRQQRRRV